MDGSALGVYSQQGIQTLPPTIGVACKSTCKDVQSDCPGWTADGECYKNPGFMYKECPNSCGVCDGIRCADNNATQCKIWAEAGECLNNPLAVMKECPDSCGLCTTVCMDHDESCRGWAKGSQCDDNKAFMYRVCPAACGICQVLEGGAGKDEL